MPVVALHDPEHRDDVPGPVTAGTTLVICPTNSRREGVGVSAGGDRFMTNQVLIGNGRAFNVIYIHGWRIVSEAGMAKASSGAGAGP